MLWEVGESFFEEEAMDGVQRELLAKMPLAEAVLLVWRHVADEDQLQAVFDRYRGRCYEQAITFASLVQLIADALLEHEGSGNQSFSRARETNQLAATPRAAYGKLSRLPISLSVGLFSELTDRLRELLPTESRRVPPKTLQEYAVVTVDGKTMKRVAKRIKPLRNVGGGVIGGKAVVATEYSTGLALAMVADLDGNTNDVRLLPDLITSVRWRLEGPRLWVADRQFCDLVQIDRFIEDGDSYVLRYNAKVKFQRDAEEPVRTGFDRQGRPYTDECGWLGRDGHRRQTYVRRVTLHRKEGDDVAIVTNLFGSRKHSAADLLDLYLERWGIERMFQHVTEVFGLKRLIGGTPEASVFQFAFCLLLYNQIQLVRAYVAKHQAMEFEKISLENLFLDAKRELIAWAVVVGADAAAEIFPSRDADSVRRRLGKLLRKQWSDRWLKSCNNRPRPHPPRIRSKSYTTAYRAIQAFHHT